MSDSLSWYIQDSAALLHDDLHQFTSRRQLVRWINDARSQVAQITGCVRRLISGASAFGAGAQPGSLIPGAGQPGALPDSAPAAGLSQTTNTFGTIAGVERYPFGFANPYLRGQHAGCKEIVDVIDVAVSWGGIRPTMAWMPWEDLQAYARSYNIGVFSYPFYWATQNDGAAGEVWLFPVPTITGQGQAAQGEMEWDVTCLPNDLYTDDDYDAIPRPFRNAVKYYAAALSFEGSQRFGMAQQMLARFRQNLPIARAASDRGKTENMYWMQDVI